MRFNFCRASARCNLLPWSVQRHDQGREHDGNKRGRRAVTRHGARLNPALRRLRAVDGTLPFVAPRYARHEGIQ